MTARDLTILFLAGWLILCFGSLAVWILMGEHKRWQVRRRGERRKGYVTRTGVGRVIEKRNRPPMVIDDSGAKES